MVFKRKLRKSKRENEREGKIKISAIEAGRGKERKKRK